ncbi:MAG: phosphatase PAP2 family protein [Phenylobacterium sp.]|uniref:acid phosphatase n=1 Tax=Phenylobacterium sp. TaxID=1871053 RepID=UPI0025FB8F12|nr:phosphatase PAP2 family protein [Phenylobacterium sp.]MBI1200506.1 phosphatase PAP2 family protein [Phenylobacterium sp.]
MRTKAILLAAAAAGLLAAAPAPHGYLGDDAPDTIAILPPAPEAGTTRYEADRTVYLATRRLEGSDRWKMAQGDVDSRAIMKDLACSLGVELTPQNAPKTSAMISKLAFDVGRATNRPKDFYKRKRPYLVDEGPICVPKDAGLAASPDYPSGHNTWGWTIGLVMAELAPDRATPILARARAFGESRLVCGVHNLSAVEAGRLNASIVVAALHGQEAFRKDMDAARLEVAAARKAGPAPDPAACAAEAAIVAKSPY